MRENRMPLGQIVVLLVVIGGLLLLLINRPAPLQIMSLAVIAKTSQDDGTLFRVDADGSHLQQLADHVRPWFAPNWSLDGKQILFVAESDLWIVDADATNKRQLTHNANLSYQPAWSPDEQSIVLISNNNLAVIDLNGTTLRHITNQAKPDATTQDEYGYFDPSWSPDGKYIAFEGYNRITKNNNIFIVDADCANPDLCENQFPGINSPLDELSYDWSPDSQSIVFGSVRSKTRLLKLYVINLTNGITQQLTNDSLTDISPNWSPDGEKISFGSVTKDMSQQFIRLIYVDGREGWTLPVDEATQIAWSPDSQLLVYGIGENLYLRAEDGSTRTINFPNMDTLTFAWRP